MSIVQDVAAAVGRTPLIKLRRASEETGCTILGKAEFMNPGQSVKDRAALFIIQDAERQRRAAGPAAPSSRARPAIPASASPWSATRSAIRTVIVIPETQSRRRRTRCACSAPQLVEVPAVPYKNPNNYVKYSARLAEALAKTEPNGAIWANQFDNVANRQAHIETTAPEIWADTDGKVDGFVSAVGSGGTLAGVPMGLKAKTRRHQDRARRSRRARRCTATTRPAC